MRIHNETGAPESTFVFLEERCVPKEYAHTI